MSTTLTISKLGQAEVIVDIIPRGNAAVRPGYAMNPTAITVHNTGNANKGAGALAHRNLLHRNSKMATSVWASYHFVVDDKKIYQLLPLNESAWHSGDGSGPKSGNRTSIGIEICENPDMDYKQAEENAIALIRHLMTSQNIPLTKVFPHQHWSGKYCPHIILSSKGGFPAFVERIKSDKTATAIKAETAKTSKTSYVGKRVESKVDGLRFYAKPSWEDKDVAGIVDKGLGFTIVSKHKVGTAYQYKVKNSKEAIYYITAADKYVTVK